jgi:hypothetical protein
MVSVWQRTEKGKNNLNVKLVDLLLSRGTNVLIRHANEQSHLNPYVILNNGIKLS